MRKGDIIDFRDYTVAELQAAFKRGLILEYSNRHTLYYDESNTGSQYRYTTSRTPLSEVITARSSIRGTASFKHVFDLCSDMRPDTFTCKVLYLPSHLYRRP